MRLAFAIGAAVLFATHAAEASDSVAMTTRAAVHDARVTREAVTWRSIYIDNEVDTGDPDHRRAIRLDLARPVHAELDAPESPGVAAIVEDESIVGFILDSDRLPGWRGAFAVTLHAPRRTVDASGDFLAPPLAKGEVPQRIVVTGDDDLRFEPGDPTLERHVGYWAKASSRESDRRALDEQIGARARLPLDDLPIYVSGADGAALIHGHFTTGPERARPGVIAATLLFVFVAGLLLVAHKRLTGRARIEQAEAILREEYGDAWKSD